MGNTQLCNCIDFTKIKCFECKREWKKSSMFQEDLFTVVVLQRPVASSPLLCVGTGRAGCELEIDLMGFILFFFSFVFFGKTIKISFVNLPVSSVLFS